MHFKQTRGWVFPWAVMALVATVSQVAWGWAGALKYPGISIPVEAGDKHDPVCSQLNKALTDRTKEFESGRFINATTWMDYAGSLEAVNQLLDDFAKVKGAVIQYRVVDAQAQLEVEEIICGRLPFVEQTPAPAPKLPADADAAAAVQPMSAVRWQVEHHGWTDPHVVTIIITLQDPGLTRDDLHLPRRAPAADAPESGTPDEADGNASKTAAEFRELPAPDAPMSESAE